MAKSKRTKITELSRTPGNVFVSVPTPKTVQQVMAAKAQPRVWAKVASQICVENTTAVETPNPESVSKIFSRSDELTKDVVLDTLRQMSEENPESDGWQDFRAIYRRLKPEYGLIEIGLLQLLWKLKYEHVIEHKIERNDLFRIKQSDVETPTTESQPLFGEVSSAYQMSTPETVPVAAAKEIRIYAVDTLSGKRQTLFTGKHTADTADLCQAYATLADCRVESHDAASATVYHPETSTIPTLSDWVEVVNSDTGQLIWVGLREDSFDARCRKYADKKGVGLRVDSAHLNHSQFYTPKNEALKYARENAKHFAEKHGLAIADAAGVITITAVAWAAYVIGGLA